MQNPCGGAIGGTGPLPGFEELCTSLERSDLELPVDELPAGPELVTAYLTSLQRLLANINPPSDSDIAVINEGGIYASGIKSLAEENRRSCPLGPFPMVIAPDVIEEAEDAPVTTLRGTVVESFPGCVLGPDGPVDVVAGGVEVDMRFARATANGRDVWRLTALQACPVSDDAAVPSELASLGRPRSSPQDSVFRFVSDYCAPAPASDAPQSE